MSYSEKQVHGHKPGLANHLSELSEFMRLTEVCGVDIVGDVGKMHVKFGVREKVAEFDNEKLSKFIEFRLKFLQEELNEAISAQHKLLSGEDSKNAAADIVDAMIDLVVVAVGTLDALQVNSDVAWTRVHEKNMQKEVGVKPNRPNPLGLPDLIKPEGWQSPEHTDNIGLLKRFL